ncbi:major facilitator superfamily transporter [Colletotrichum orchidophilum]|uniref:Major facilitator superfamily transporter n=1 Tax=Colletotrichum orchidophilum TaxID=1209926 RepID=A0A1G4B5G8_9PEZI|nr:major facilitator superfamily transporter [Colletotrichum orchidophilum]OHE96566.1 major facilitator superfamily transporter [Colletotrichum orchidophilum]
MAKMDDFAAPKSPHSTTSSRGRRDSRGQLQDDNVVVNEETPLLKASHSNMAVPSYQTPDLSLVAETDAPQQPVSWMSMPKKWQLGMVVFARLAEPLAERSLTSYLFYQLRWLSPTLPDSAIARQAGLLTASFAAAQGVTGMLWGHVADSPLFGRKRVLLVGLLGTCVSAIGMGLSTSYASVVFFRVLAGALNGNVGVLRTMISEIVEDKRYRSRAFLLLPMCFNVGVIIGPLLGGFLADPIASLPSIFGPGSFFGGKDGVEWMERFPYALTNFVCSSILMIAALGVVLGLDETHPLRRHRRDRGRDLGRFLLRKVFRMETPPSDYHLIGNGNEPGQLVAEAGDVEDQSSSSKPVEEGKDRAPLRAICTRNVILTLAQNFSSALHVSAFNSILFVMLPAPQSDNTNAQLPFRFTGGLGLSSQKVGFANTVIGAVGLPLQILLFPWISSRLGVLQSYRTFLPFSALAYCSLPYLALLSNESPFLWPCLSAILSAQVMSRTFVGPATIMLVNDSAPHPALLATVHGVASSTSAAARMLGPTIGGTVLGWGLSNNFVGAPFWGIALVSLINWSLLYVVREGNAI